jgi:hypothetical protein
LASCTRSQVVLAQPDNQPHRADLAKMLVHRRARRHTLGATLLGAAESTARECSKTVLVLDALTGGDAARLYEPRGLDPGWRYSPICLDARRWMLQYDGPSQDEWCRAMSSLLSRRKRAALL